MTILKHGIFYNQNLEIISKKIRDIAKSELYKELFGDKNYAICTHCKCEFTFPKDEIKTSIEVSGDTIFAKAFISCPDCHNVIFKNQL
jgi:hypothetical protein